MTTIDPICGMTVDSSTAADSASRNGETYYFCSKGCEAEFVAEGPRPLRAVAIRPAAETDIIGAAMKHRVDPYRKLSDNVVDLETGRIAAIKLVHEVTS